MTGKGNNKQKEKLIQELNKHIGRIQDSLNSLKESVDTLQEGDGDTPYWNGNNAYSAIRNVLVQYEMDSTLLRYIQECQGSIKK